MRLLDAKAIEMAELGVLSDDGLDDEYSKWFQNCRAALTAS